MKKLRQYVSRIGILKFLAEDEKEQTKIILSNIDDGVIIAQMNL